MNTKPAPQLLRVSQPSKSQVTFCQPTPKDLSRWLADLPKANIGETAKRLYQALLELNDFVASNELRLSLLELMRPEVFAICRNLERYFLGQSIVLDERARKIANLCQALQNHLAAGYKFIATTELRSAQPQTQTVLAQALQRTLYSIYQILTRTSRLYHPVADGLWLELHQLYQVAHRQGIDQLVLNEPQAHGQPGLSIAQTYLLSQLLGCAQANQIRQTDIARLSEVLERWVSFVSLTDGVNEQSLFVICPNQDKSPRYRSLGLFRDTAQLLSINTQPLTDAIEQYLLMPEAKQPALYVPEYFSQDLLRHLAAAWSEVAERTFQRTAKDGEIHVSLGMSAVHYACAGQRAFDELISSTQAAPLEYKEQERVDIWANAIDAQGDTRSARIEYEEIPFSAKPAPAPEPAKAVYQSIHWPLSTSAQAATVWPGQVRCQASCKPAKSSALASLKVIAAPLVWCAGCAKHAAAQPRWALNF